MGDEKLIKGIGLDLSQLDKDIQSANKKLSELGTKGLGIKPTLSNAQTSVLQIVEKMLDELIHKYKTLQVTSEEFLKQASGFRVYKDLFDDIGSKKQVELTQLLLKAEKEYQNVLDERYKVNEKNLREVEARSKVEKSLHDQKMREIKAEQDAINRQTGKIEKQATREYINSWTAKIKEIEDRNELQFKIDNNIEKREQQEYINSWTAKINEIEQRNKLQIKTDEAVEKREQQEYINSWTSKINEIETRNKLQFKIDDAIAKKEQDEYVRSWTAKINEVEERNKKAASLFNTALQSRIGSSANLNTLGSGDARSSYAQKFANSAIYGSAYRMQSSFISMISMGVEAIKQYEVGINDLRRTLEDATNTELKNFGEQAIVYSKNFGIAIGDVQSAMTELARAGVKKEDLNSLTETVLAGVNTTEVKNSAEMVGYLVSAIKQLGMGMSDSMVIIDSWNKLADKYAVQTDDFAKSIQRAGSASRLLGLDLHDLSAMTVILGEATQASGEQVGQALKSLEVRLLRPETVKTLESYGIAVKKNEDSFLSFQEIMNNVNARIEKLSEDSVELNTIMDALGGSWRKNWVQILANDWDRFNDIVVESKNSIGYSIKENELVVQTFEKQIESLKNAWNELFVKFAENSGLFGQIKGVFSGLTDFASFVANTDGKLMRFVLVLAEVGTGIKLLSMGLKQFTGIGVSDWLSGVIQSVTKLSNVTKTATNVTEMLNKARKAGNITMAEQEIIMKAVNEKLGVANVSTKALNTAQQALHKTQSGLALSTLAVNAALTAGIIIITSAITAYWQRMEDLKRKSEELINKKNEEIRKLQELKKEYNDLYQQQEDGKDVLDQIKNVEKEILDLLPAKQHAWQAEIDARQQINKAIDSQIEKNRLLVAEQLRADVQKVYDKNVFRDVKNINDASRDIQILGNILDNFKVDTKGNFNITEIIESIGKETYERLFWDTLAYSSKTGNFIGYEPLTEKKVRFEHSRRNTTIDTSEDLQKNIDTLINYYSNKYGVFDDNFSKLITESILEGKILQTEQAIENVFKNYNTVEWDWLKKDNLPKTDNNTNEGYIGSSSSRSVIQKLYQAGIISDEQYLSRLNNLVDTEYGYFKNVNNDEIESLLKEPNNERVSEYLEILKDIEQVTERLSKKGENTGLTEATPSLLKKDRYAQLEAELNKTDILLEKNAALQELNKNDRKLLDEEISLLKQKQNQLHVINEERRKERSELQSTLSAQGFQFAGTGDSASITNYTQVVSKLIDEVNKHRNDKDKTYYNTLQQRLEDAQNNAKRFFDLQINEINKTSNEWWKYQKSIADVNGEIQELAKNQQEIFQKSNDELLKIYEDANKQIVNALKDRYDQEKKLRQRDHDDAIQKLDDQYKAFEDYINKEIKLLDDQYSEEDFLKELSDERKKAHEIQMKINELSLDDSTEARTKVFELNKELSEQEEKISKLKTDKEKDSRKKNLQEQLNNYKDHIDKQKSIEDDNFEAFSRRIEDATEETALALEAEKLLITGTQNDLIALFTEIGLNATEAGKLIQSEILDKLALVKEIGGNLGNIKGDSSGNNPLGMSRSDFAQYLANKKAYETASVSERDKLRASNDAMRKKYGISGDSYSYDQLKSYYDEGGVALGKGVLLKNTLSPERVLSPAQTRSFDRLVDILDRLPELRVLVPNFRTPSLDFGGGSISIDASIYVEGSVDKSFWLQLKQAHENQIDKITKHLNIPTVRRGSI